MKIFKFLLQLTDRQIISAPYHAKFLTAQMQREHLCLWAECNPQDLHELRHIAIYGTGNPIPDNPGTYIATVQVNHQLVFHVYEVKQ